ncbi:uncharacterized protein B0T15DRAFT_545691 [Chaetomium strumarium]|uniref:Chromo domain-containing protein n=1 Tax=Chaetomium strumarium TaxID=1170767 RepID=A0AAJ0M5K5_9PEZI|nr:hypothetical protein B0T15DRAFT_545691 [Chaetomium strumarium]
MELKAGLKELKNAEACVHPTVSITQVVKAPDGEDPYGRSLHGPGPVIEATADGKTEQFEIEKILARRSVRKGVMPQIEYLIKWKGRGSHDNQWCRRAVLMQNGSDMINEYEAKFPITEKERKPRRPPLVEGGTSAAGQGSAA